SSESGALPMYFVFSVTDKCKRLLKNSTEPGTGVYVHSQRKQAIERRIKMATLTGSSSDPGVPGVRGDSTQFDGVLGVSTASGHAGVAGVNESGGNGVMGRGTGNGVFWHSRWCGRVRCCGDK